MDNRPIGFLDSGVGGLTVVRELKRKTDKRGHLSRTYNLLSIHQFNNPFS